MRLLRLGVVTALVGVVIVRCGADALGFAGVEGDRDGSLPTGRLVAYVSGYGPEIGWYSVDEACGALGATGAIRAIGNGPSFLAWNRTRRNLYAVDEASGRVAAYAVDAKSGALTFLNDVSSRGNGPAHLSVDATGKWVFVANYGDGTVAVLPVAANGSLGDAVHSRVAGANAHMIIADPTNHFVFVPCKGADMVAQYVFDPATGSLTPNAVPALATAPDAGPRHLAFHPNGKHAYLIAENASTVTTLAFDAQTGRLTALDSTSTLAPGSSAKNTGAEILVHPTGNWVYASNRGDDSIASFSVDATSGKLTMTSVLPDGGGGGSTKTGGKTPRHMSLTPEGTLLYAANQGSGTIARLQVNGDGRLVPTNNAISVTTPSFVGVLRLAP
jgi:6-phosphogluconolactonase